MWFSGVRSSWRRCARLPGSSVIGTPCHPPTPLPTGRGEGGPRDPYDDRTQVSSSQERLDLAEEPLELDRLRVEVVAPGGQSLLTVPGHGVRGEGNDGDRLRGGMGAQLPR